ncbi:unnamed protein product [Arabis nemorensis]|uniref:Uncharacterized protein n=1 Tax=Arabis nemorensis TaxID=586526 RepID=A0A565C904_9BRAS|nr:unnamed protein product [Arabis nemorensis]
MVPKRVRRGGPWSEVIDLSGSEDTSDEVIGHAIEESDSEHRRVSRKNQISRCSHRYTMEWGHIEINVRKVWKVWNKNRRRIQKKIL